MKKLLSTFLLAILILANTSVVFAEDEVLTPRQEKQQCRQDCREAHPNQENRADRQACYETCDVETDETVQTPVGEIGVEGEIKKTILPPIEKPAFLPGPNIDDNTGDSVREYVTQRFLPSIAKRLTTIVAVISLLGLVYAGILFFTAAGVTDKIDKAKKAAIYAVVGLVLSLLSFTIVQIVNLLPLG